MLSLERFLTDALVTMFLLPRDIYIENEVRVLKIKLEFCE